VNLKSVNKKEQNRTSEENQMNTGENE